MLFPSPTQILMLERASMRTAKDLFTGPAPPTWTACKLRDMPQSANRLSQLPEVYETKGNLYEEGGFGS